MVGDGPEQGQGPGHPSCLGLLPRKLGPVPLGIKSGHGWERLAVILPEGSDPRVRLSSKLPWGRAVGLCRESTGLWRAGCYWAG